MHTVFDGRFAVCTETEVIINSNQRSLSSESVMYYRIPRMKCVRTALRWSNKGRGSVGLNIERLVSGWSEGMGFTAVLVLIEWVKTGC